MNNGQDPQTQKFLQQFEGTLVQKITVSGNRAYTLDLGLRANPPHFLNPPFTALEVYDISTPTAPVWLSATEAFSSHPSLFSTYSHYLFEVDTGVMVGPGNP